MNINIMDYPKTTSYGEIGRLLPYILKNILNYKIDGTFVEVGANDGKQGSFTYNLANIGWNGYYCEPIPRLWKLCELNHKNNTNTKIIPYGCGEKEDVLHILDADTLSSIDDTTINHVKSLSWARGFFNNNNKISINIKKLDTILKENNVIDIDLLVIDVEGFEENVLKGFTIEEYNVTIIIIEIADTHPDFINNIELMEKFKRIRKYFVDKNYILLANDIVDNIYLPKYIYDKLDSQFIEIIKTNINHIQYNN